MTIFSKEQCLAVVEASPQAVAVHDRAAWLALFGSRAQVEDPVGSRPHWAGMAVDPDAMINLGSFYDTFIGPNQIRFLVERDIVSGLQVMRDLTIEIEMSRHVTVRVPMHLLYELAEERGELRIQRLAAHWELWPMLKQQVANGWYFLGVGCTSGMRMLRFLGVSGMLGFASGATGVGPAGKDQLHRFADYLRRGDALGLGSLFLYQGAIINDPSEQTHLSLAALAARGGELEFGKMLAAGSVVSTTLVYRGEGEAVAGVALFKFEPRSLKITSLTFYRAGD